MNESRTAAVVLAAGAGTRFRGPVHKLLAGVDGVPLVVHSVDAALRADFAGVVVISGAVPLDAVLADHQSTAAVRVVENPLWEAGIATSLARGLEEAAALGCDSVVVGLADMPEVTTADWLAVSACRDTPIAVTRWAGGILSPPVRLHRSVWPDLPDAGDFGARVLWSGRPDLVTEVARPGSGLDVDVVADLA